MSEEKGFVGKVGIKSIMDHHDDNAHQEEPDHFYSDLHRPQDTFVRRLDWRRASRVCTFFGGMLNP